MKKLINEFWWIKLAPIGVAIAIGLVVAELVNLKRKN